MLSCSIHLHPNFSWFLPTEHQGISWETQAEGRRPSLEQTEPLYASPRKEHHKFNLDHFTLHKMLGKGSFGKVIIVYSTHSKHITAVHFHLNYSIQPTYVWNDWPGNKTSFDSMGQTDINTNLQLITFEY